MLGFWTTTSDRVGLVVAGAWLILALSGRWRADPGWIDRLGCALGACWVGWLLVELIPWTFLQWSQVSWWESRS